MTGIGEQNPGEPAGPAAESAASVILIRPTRGWSALGLHDVWEYRSLLYFLIWRDLKARYRQMALGPLWIILTPLASMGVFTILFGVLAKLPSNDLPSPIYYYAALLPWQLFAASARYSATSLSSNLNLISKVYFPRLIMPISSCAAGLVDFAFSFLILIGMMAYYRDHITLSAAVLTVPIYLVLAVATALAIGLWLAALAVRFRDVTYGVSFVLQFWMFLTVIYPSTNVPGRWQVLYRLNPMQVVVEGFRWGLMGKGFGPDGVQAVSAAAVLVLLVAGAYVFRRAERNIVDVM